MQTIIIDKCNKKEDQSSHKLQLYKKITANR